MQLPNKQRALGDAVQTEAGLRGGPADARDHHAVAGGLVNEEGTEEGVAERLVAEPVDDILADLLLVGGCGDRRTEA